MNKTIHFYYKRDSLPHSEYKVVKSLNKFLEDRDKNEYKISTSTAAIFNIVRAFCRLHKLSLIAYYEDSELKLEGDMGMNDWSNCPDFEIEDKAFEILFMTSENDINCYSFVL